jgi:predicted lipid-binding transport protein (Tim44 family)
MDTIIDILFFAIVAIVLLGRLWQIMGRQSNDDEKLPPLVNPFAADPTTNLPKDVVVLPDRKTDKPAVLTDQGHAVASLAGALDRLQTFDPVFDEKTFLEGAKNAFESIVNAFAKGDLVSVERLLSPSVLASFKRAIPPDLSFSPEPRLVRITEASLLAVALDKDEARLTVEFQSLQKPASSGGQLVEIRDRWVFGRKMTSPDPNWLLVATSA